MKDRENDIMRYHLGKMSEEERQAFQAEIESDDALREAVEEDAFNRNIADFLRREDMRRRVEAVARRIKVRRVSRIVLGTAAALVMVVGGWMLLTKGGSSRQDLLQEFAGKWHPLAHNVLSVEDSSLQKLQQDYQRGNYDAALSRALQLPRRDRTDSVEVGIWIGFAELQLGEYEKAKVALEELKSIRSDRDAEVRWGLAIAYVATSQDQRALEQLDWLINDRDKTNPLQREKAQSFKEAIESLSK